LAIGARSLAAGPMRGALTLIWAVIRAMSINPFKVLSKLNERGRGCRIHPRAVVEGCRLGDNVEVDAGAVLRGCFVGDGVKIGANTISEFSVFGDGSRLTRQGGASLSVIYPNTSIGGYLQLSLAGEGVTTKLWSAGYDMKVGAPVCVKTPHGLAAVDIGYQGVCLGHRVFVGSGVWIAPGRILEPDRLALRDPRNIIMK